MTDFEIHHGNALDVLRAMPAESVQCCVTSPPYYGLRSYKTVPQVWDNHNGCGHEFGETIGKKISLQAGNPEFVRPWRENATDTAAGSAFCISCNAWRGELGLEPTFQLYISHLIQIFAEVRRVLKKDGVCFVNLGDSYTGSGKGGQSDEKRSDNWAPQYPTPNELPSKCLMNIPARFAIAMTDELGFVQRNELIWHKPACMPSSAKDRWTVDFEPIYFFAKGPKYKFNQRLEPVAESTIGRKPVDFGGKKGREFQPESDDVAFRNGSEQWGRTFDYTKSCENGRNARTVMKINFEPSSDPHFASYPTKLVEPLILAGSDEGDTVLDIFAGTGTTLLTALRHRRRALGIELNPDYIEIAERRLAEVQVKLF